MSGANAESRGRTSPIGPSVMKPIFIILYAIVVTLILTLVLPRLQPMTPGRRRAMWILAGVGLAALLVVLIGLLG